MKVAIVHDYLTHLGGAERVLERFHSLWPEAPIFTLLYDEQQCRGRFVGADIRVSGLQHVPFATRFHRGLPLFMPMAIEQIDLSGFDLVVSSSTSFAKGVLCDVGTTHISYCHTPMRYAWEGSHKTVQLFRSFRVFGPVVPLGLNYVRMWDTLSAQRPDYYIANSKNVQRRILKYYRRASEVVYPPVDVTRFSSTPSQQRDGGIFMVGRLLPYKGFDIGIKACALAGCHLTIIGDGPERRRLERLAHVLRADVDFLGECSDAEVVDSLYSAKALLFPGVEDFGIVPLEAMLAGCPVIARASGGALETVVNEVTGLHVFSSHPADFSRAISLLDSMHFDRSYLRAHAFQFSFERFDLQIRNIVERYVV